MHTLGPTVKLDSYDKGEKGLPPYSTSLVLIDGMQWEDDYSEVIDQVYQEKNLYEGLLLKNMFGVENDPHLLRY